MANSGKLKGSAAVEDALRRAKTALDQGHAAEAEQLAESVIEREPRHAGALQLLGGALLLQARFEEAIAPLDGAARVLRDPSLDTQLAIALRESGRHGDALARLKRAVKREPPYVFAFHELGYLLYTLKRTDEAIAAIERGIEIAPLTTNLFVLLGSVCHARGDLPRARAAFARALSISPQLAAAHYGIGATLMLEGAYKPAIEHFRMASMSDPADQQARLKLAGCLLEAGDTDAALTLLRNVVQGDRKGYLTSLKVVQSSGRGRFWLRPSAAARALAQDRAEAGKS